MEGSHHHHHQYLMWLKRKQVLKSHIEAARSSSWEERAFAEDAARILGGYVWPPRSYSCTFCKREFRSAQALGGHMNVHRRDRARLKQNQQQQQTSVLPPPPHHHHHDCNNNKRSSDSEVIAAVVNGREDEEDEEDFASAFISHGNDNNHHHHNNFVETDLSVGLLSSSSSAEDQALSCKRTKTSSVFIKPFPNDHAAASLVLQSAEMVIGVHKPAKMEDLDLELRLGKLPQKVK